MTRSMLYVLAMSAVLTVDAIAQVQSLTPAEMARYTPIDQQRRRG